MIHTKQEGPGSKSTILKLDRVICFVYCEIIANHCKNSQLNHNNEI